MASSNVMAAIADRISALNRGWATAEETHPLNG